MNDEFPIDPALQSLEGRLSAARPKLSDREAQELLYQCAFVAGQKLAARRTRRWQIASAAMAVLLMGVSVSLLNKRVLVAEREPGTTDTAAPGQVQAPDVLLRVTPIQLDAWQAPADTAAKFETALTRFKQLDANSRSLAVGPMTRAAGTVP